MIGKNIDAYTGNNDSEKWLNYAIDKYKARVYIFDDVGYAVLYYLGYDFGVQPQEYTRYIEKDDGKIFELGIVGDIFDEITDEKLLKLFDDAKLKKRK